MRTRLEDLLATADRQLAVRSYDAAIDTLRTALSEPGAEEARVAEKLETACRERDAARGIARPVELAIVVEQVEATPEPAAAPVEEESVQPPIADIRPIEAPAFELMEDHPAMLERAVERRTLPDVEKLSILDPKPLPEEPIDPVLMARIAVAGIIVAVVCIVVFLLK